MLHLVKHSPFASHALAQCLELVAKDDVILLLEDAVIAALDGQPLLAALKESQAEVFALADDLDARGVSARLSCSIPAISMHDFVTLTEQHHPLVSW